MVIKSAAYKELRFVVDVYKRFLPIKTFPFVMLSVAAIFQVLAWFGGTLFPTLSMVPRVLALWGLALIEYSVMSPTMSASIELLGYSESFLVVLNHVLPFLVFMIMNRFIFKSPFTWRHTVAICLVVTAVAIISP